MKSWTGAQVSAEFRVKEMDEMQSLTFHDLQKQMIDNIKAYVNEIK
jgi:hypothetical protein